MKKHKTLLLRAILGDDETQNKSQWQLIAALNDEELTDLANTLLTFWSRADYERILRYDKQENK